jgi:hypothetical protein
VGGEETNVVETRRRSGLRGAVAGMAVAVLAVTGVVQLRTTAPPDQLGGYGPTAYRVDGFSADDLRGAGRVGDGIGRYDPARRP